MIVIFEVPREPLLDPVELGEHHDQLFVTLLRFNQLQDVERLRLSEKLQDSFQKLLAVIAWPSDDSGACDVGSRDTAIHHGEIRTEQVAHREVRDVLVNSMGRPVAEEPLLSELKCGVHLFTEGCRQVRRGFWSLILVISHCHLGKT